MKRTLITSILAILLLLTTETFAVVGINDTSQTVLSKKERKQLKRQQKLSKWAEKIYDSKLGEFIDNHFSLADSTTCDTIVLRNGRKIIAQIYQVHKDNIEYTKCNDLNSPKILLSGRALKEIRYQDGTLSSFENTANEIASPVPQNIARNERELRAAKTTGIIVGIFCGILAGYLLGLIGMLILYLCYRNKNREVRKMAMKHAWILFGAFLFLVICFLLVALSF